MGFSDTENPQRGKCRAYSSFVLVTHPKIMDKRFYNRVIISLWRVSFFCLQAWSGLTLFGFIVVESFQFFVDFAEFFSIGNFDKLHF